MTDVILVAVIVAFFVAGALLVRALDGMITPAGSESDSDRDPEDEPGAAR
jgi:hypothetical protein